MDKQNLLKTLLSMTILTIIIIASTSLLINQKLLIGPLMVLLGIISLIPAFLYKISIKVLKSDIIFGMIDNGILAVFAITGAELFGVFGAIIGSAIGNAITDGIAGIFEGLEEQKLGTKEKKNLLGVATGKLAGCLLGSGIILTIVWTMLGL